MAPGHNQVIEHPSIVDDPEHEMRIVSIISSQERNTTELGGITEQMETLRAAFKTRDPTDEEAQIQKLQSITTQFNMNEVKLRLVVDAYYVLKNILDAEENDTTVLFLTLIPKLKCLAARVEIHIDIRKHLRETRFWVLAGMPMELVEGYLESLRSALIKCEGDGCVGEYVAERFLDSD